MIYCQEIEGYHNRSYYLNTEQMIRITAQTCADEPVYVKPHPLQSKSVRKAIMDVAADYRNVTVTDASVHDLTDASRMVVTQNSAAAFEALMQKRCVITCAKSDFWHATLTPKIIKMEKQILEASWYRTISIYRFDKFIRLTTIFTNSKKLILNLVENTK